MTVFLLSSLSQGLEHMNTLGTGRWYVETVSCHPRNASSRRLVESTHHQLWIHSLVLFSLLNQVLKTVLSDVEISPAISELKRLL